MHYLVNIVSRIFDRVHIVFSNGRHSGEGFVDFQDKGLMRKALAKHRHLMGPRYIELFETDNLELDYVLSRHNF